jgi:hypothetical protein
MATNWTYNGLVINMEDIDNTALNAAENYLYDKKNFNRPTSAMRAFFEDFGECDEPIKYEGLFGTYLCLYEKHLNDPELIEKYNDDDDYDEDDDDYDEDDDEKCWICDGFTIDMEVLDNWALTDAENYLYDKKNFNTPTSPMQAFFEDWRECDDPIRYERMVGSYLVLYEKHLNDPELIEKYNDDDDYDEDDDEKCWSYNGLKVEFSELDNLARYAAKNYWHNVQKNKTPENEMTFFHIYYGRTDKDETQYEGLYRAWLELYEQHKSDPLIRAKCE